MAIKITPAELRDLASKLDSNATETASLASSITGSFEAGTANFEGNTADRYAAAFQEMIPTMSTKLPALLQEFASELRSTADAFEQLDG